MITTVLLTEKTLTAHDVERFAHLHDPEPVRIHVVVPAGDDRSDFAEAVDDLSRAEFREAVSDAEADQTPETLRSAAQIQLDASIQALRDAGVQQVDGEIAPAHPVDAVAAIATRLEADEVVVLTEPHLVADLTRRDWATRLRHHLALPVLHVVIGTDQVVS